MVQYPIRVRNAGRRRRGMRCAGNLVRPRDRVLLAKSSSAKRGNTETRSLITVLPASTLFNPSIGRVSFDARVLVTPLDVRVAAPGETRIGVVVCEFIERTSAAPPFIVHVLDVNVSGSTSPAVAVGGMTAVGDTSMCEDGDMTAKFTIVDAESNPAAPFAVPASAEQGSPPKNVSVRLVITVLSTMTSLHVALTSCAIWGKRCG
jgi:hypothetical protein